MRVAMVSEHASPLAALGEADGGGQNVHVAALALALGRKGHEVVVHTRREDPEVPTRLRLGPGAEVHQVDAGPARRVPKDELLPHMDQFASGLRARWAHEPPDVVHAHFWMSGRAALAARPSRRRPPVVQTFHALGVVKRRHLGDGDPSPAGRLGEEERIARSADHVVATSSDEVFELVRLGTSRRRVSVIPCGVDLERFTPEGPAEPRRAGVHRIVCLARLVERKGVADAVAALVELPDTELVVAGGPEASLLGDDGEARRLRALAAELGVARRVHLRGRVERPDIPALLRSADAAVCVPWYEPFGIVPLEAMACGVPVVASAVGGQIDSVVDGVTGVHVAPRHPEQLAAVLRELFGSPRRRHALGAAGARRARQRYGWDRIAASSLEVYRTLLAARSAGSQGVSA